MARDTKARRPEDFADEFAALLAVPGRHWSVIGGMAAIIWTERFLTREQYEGAGMKLPLSSKDLDVRGSQAHALIVKGIWGAESSIFKLKWKKLEHGMERHSWTVASHEQGDPRRRVVEVTELVPGLEQAEGFSIRIVHRGVTVRVLDPISCLIAKNDVLGREMNENVKGNRKDAIHVTMLRQVIPCYLEEVASARSETIRLDQELARSKSALALAEQLLATWRQRRADAAIADYIPPTEPSAGDAHGQEM